MEGWEAMREVVWEAEEVEMLVRAGGLGRVVDVAVTAAVATASVVAAAVETEEAAAQGSCKKAPAT